MPVELRKRKAVAAPAAAPAPAKKKTSQIKAVASKVKEVVTSKTPTPSTISKTATKGKAVSVGQILPLEGFGGEVETQDGQKTSLKLLVEKSKGGVALFTYPKASTPGCTNQACLFRDNYSDLTSAGLAIYGLSTDSPKSNTTFKTKQNLPYDLLCDPSASLIGAIGLKKAPKGTTRGVFVIDKQGKVLLAEPGSPAGTVDAVKKVVKSVSGEGDVGLEAGLTDVEKDDKKKADVAADVADTAAKIDGNGVGT